MKYREVKDQSTLMLFIKEETECSIVEADYLVSQILMPLHYRFGMKRPSNKDVVDFAYEEMSLCTGLFNVKSRMKIDALLKKMYFWHNFPWSRWRVVMKKCVHDYSKNKINQELLFGRV